MVYFGMQNLAKLQEFLLLPSQRIPHMIETRVDLFADFLVALLVELFPFVKLLKLEFRLLNFRGVQTDQLLLDDLGSFLFIIDFVLLAERLQAPNADPPQAGYADMGLLIEVVVAVALFFGGRRLHQEEVAAGLLAHYGAFAIRVNMVLLDGISIWLGLLSLLFGRFVAFAAHPLFQEVVREQRCLGYGVIVRAGTCRRPPASGCGCGRLPAADRPNRTNANTREQRDPSVSNRKRSTSPFSWRLLF